MNTIKVCVASQNPTKVNATLKAFKEVFPQSEIKVEGYQTDSKVSEQPIGNEETLAGALNRAKNIKNTYTADYHVGIEGGLIKHGSKEMEAMAWMVVMKGTKIGKARTAGFFIAKQTIDLIHEGKELGLADEIIFGIENTKQKMGSSGLLTNNIISRERFYTDTLILALIPFIKTELFPSV